jgi:SAM-dependent methyltransferase
MPFKPFGWRKPSSNQAKKAGLYPYERILMSPQEPDNAATDDPPVSGAPLAKRSLRQDDNLVAAWDVAAKALDEDPMRPIRYAKCFRYLGAALEKDSRILEIGCGEGTGLAMLGQLGFHNVFGVEVSGERLKRASVKLPRDVQLQQISPTERLPFQNDYFDAVITAAVIEHTVNREEFIRELARVTKVGGCVVLSSDCYSWRVLQLLGVYQSLQPIDKAPFPLALARQFRRSGLDLLHCEGFPLPGQEYRFFRLIVGKAVSVVKRTAKPAVRLLRKMTGTPSRQHPALAKPKCERSQIRKGVQHEKWKPLPLLRSMPGLLLSDENVFFLRKRPADDSSR